MYALKSIYGKQVCVEIVFKTPFGKLTKGELYYIIVKNGKGAARFVP